MPDERQQQILDAAAAVIVRLGYDKTTMTDVANEAGVSRGTVYLHFPGKEELFEALFYREWTRYAALWLEAMEADPRGGTVGGYYRALFHAIHRCPLIASIMRQDRRIIGSYLRKPDNLFAWMVSGPITLDLIRALQAAGTVRSDVDPAIAAHIIEMLSLGQLVIGDFRTPDQLPPYDAVMETLADMMDRLLTPADGGSSDAGKAVVREMVAAAMTRLEQVKQTRDAKQTLRKEITHDNR